MQHLDAVEGEEHQVVIAIAVDIFGEQARGRNDVRGAGLLEAAPSSVATDHQKNGI